MKILLPLILLVLPYLSTQVEVDLCVPRNDCQVRRSSPSRFRGNLHNFKHALMYSKEHLVTLLANFRTGDYGSESQDVPCDLPFTSQDCQENDLIEDLFISYKHLTELVANLTLLDTFNKGRFKTPMCYLGKALGNLDFEVPCASCKKNPPVIGPNDHFSFFTRTLQCGINLINNIKTHFHMHGPLVRQYAYYANH